MAAITRSFSLSWRGQPRSFSSMRLFLPRSQPLSKPARGSQAAKLLAPTAKPSLPTWPKALRARQCRLPRLSRCLLWQPTWPPSTAPANGSPTTPQIWWCALPICAASSKPAPLPVCLALPSMALNAKPTRTSSSGPGPMRRCTLAGISTSCSTTTRAPMPHFLAGRTPIRAIGASSFLRKTPRAPLSSAGGRWPTPLTIW